MECKDIWMFGARSMTEHPAYKLVSQELTNDVSSKKTPATSIDTDETIAKNHIVARFAGRMEYGPRALGNRSILYPAQDPEVNLWLNHQLGRTEFMPFAPAAMAEHAPRLFKAVDGCEKTA